MFFSLDFSFILTTKKGKKRHPRFLKGYTYKHILKSPKGMKV